MNEEQTVFVKCTLERGGFPTECVFRLKMNGHQLTGIAPLSYCYTPERKQLSGELPAGKPIDGYIVAVEINTPERSSPLYYLPDGQLYEDLGDLVETIKRPDRVSVKS